MNVRNVCIMYTYMWKFWLISSWRHNVCSCGVNCWGGAEENWPPLWWRITQTHILCMTMNVCVSYVFFYYMTTFPEKLTTSGTMMTTLIYIFCVSMCMTLCFFVYTYVVCLLVWLLLSGKVTTTTLLLHWWRVTRTHKLCWFPCPCVTLWLWKYWKFQFEI